MERLYRRTDVFVMPSLVEGFGMVLLEAMSYGVPCIGTKTGGITEIVQDRKNGMLIKPMDTGAISSAVNRMLSDGKLRKNLSKNARITAGKFRFDNLIKKMESVYKEL